MLWALLIASTLYQRRQVNVRKCEINSCIKACKQTIDQSHLQLSDRARNNCQRIEMVSIWQFSCLMRQKLANTRCQAGNFGEQQSCSTDVCLKWALDWRTLCLLLQQLSCSSSTCNLDFEILCFLSTPCGRWYWVYVYYDGRIRRHSWWNSTLIAFHWEWYLTRWNWLSCHMTVNRPHRMSLLAQQVHSSHSACFHSFTMPVIRVPTLRFSV